MLNNVPLAGQNLLQTRDAIANNFTTIDNAFSVNHVPYGTTGAGKHNFVTFPVQAGSPAIVYPDTGLFSKLNATSGVNELYYINSTKTIAEVPLTAGDITGTGWCYWPNGMLIKWGTTGPLAVNSSTNVTASQGPAYAVVGGIKNVQLTATTATTTRDIAFVGITGVANQFVVRCNSGMGAPGAYYFIIGTTV